MAMRDAWSGRDAPNVEKRHAEARKPQHTIAVERWHRRFRRNFLDRQDPFESAGRLMHDFTFYGAHALHAAPPEQVAEEIRAEILGRLEAGQLPETHRQIHDLDDAKLPSEPARRFLVIHTDTHRDTLITVNAFIRAYGGYLYFSVRSYILPPLSLWKTFFASLFVLFVLSNMARADQLLGMVGATGMRLFSLLMGVAFLAWTFRRLIRNLAAGDGLFLSLRKQFPKKLDGGSFDMDDTSAFLKTSVTLALSSIGSVLERHGVRTEAIRQMVNNVQINNISSGGGNIVGAMVGGVANRLGVRTGR